MLSKIIFSRDKMDSDHLSTSV